jgi:hypothetical protein
MKRFGIYSLFLIFFTLITYSGYLYSLRWNFFNPVAGLRDGLFFLAFYIIILPLLLLVSSLKTFYFKSVSNSFLKFSFFLYTLLIAFPSVDTTGSQMSLGIGTIFSFLCGLWIVAEFYKIVKTGLFF